MPISKKKTIFRTSKKPSAQKPKTRAKRVRLAIECTPVERRQMKMLAASEDKTLNEFVLESVRMRFKRCNQSHTPNSETAKVLEEAENGKNLIEFDSVEDFFKSLEK